MSGPPVQFYESAGQKTAYRIYGSRQGTPLIMVQGMSAVGTVDFHEIATALSRNNRTVVTLDNRDFGQSTWDVPADQEKKFTLNDLGQDVVKLVQHLGYKEIDLLGHSMGGMICQVLLTTPDLPIKIKHCVLGATSPSPPKSDLGAAVTANMRKMASGNNTKSKAEQSREMTEVLMTNCYDEVWIRENPKIYQRRVQESLDSRRPLKTVMIQQRAIGKYDVRDKLSSIPSSIPVLVIYGNKDVAVYPDDSKAILKGIRHATVLKAPSMDMGHNWYDYHTMDFWVKSIDGFLEGGEYPKAKL